MIQLTIDGLPIQVEDNTTILGAADKLKIYIPTLCHHPDQVVKAHCRICLVENEGMHTLIPACSCTAGEAAPVNYRRSPRQCIL